MTVGSFKSDDNGDGTENGKKALGLDWQNNNFARASRVFVHFRSRRWREHKATIFFFFLEIWYSPLVFKGVMSRNSAKLGNYKMPVKLRAT